MDGSNRLYCLDNLRAVMMWLGIVLHVCLNHMVTTTAAFWRDTSTTIAADWIFLVIHAFRMPVFFILAGFFAALLVQSRGYSGMLRHRLRRIGLPFLIFWPLLFVATVVLLMVYLHLMAHGSLGFDPALKPADSPDRARISTLHLWFIYYLLWYCLLAAGCGAIGKSLPAPIKESIDRMWRTLGGRWWGFAALALPLAIAGSGYANGVLGPSGSFIPHAAELIHNGVFFAFGWYLHRHHDSLLPLYAKHCWKFAFGGALPFMVSLALLDYQSRMPQAFHLRAAIAYGYNSAGWLWSFALIGCFVRYLPRQNRVLQYISESSYWMYLVHMLGTIGFGIVLYKLPLGAVSKMSLNILLTSAVCLLTYQLFVRHTRLGLLLNGRRRGEPHNAPASALAASS